MSYRAGQRTHNGKVLWITSYLHLCPADPCPCKPVPISPEAQRMADEAIRRAYEQAERMAPL